MGKRNLARIPNAVKTAAEPALYSGFAQIDGRHPWQEAVPDGYVLYNARMLRGSKVVYFNFALAKEMGLLPENHPHKLNARLEKILRDTFALQIINEYDVAKNKKFPKKDIKPFPYMATRYLQLQHSSKTGATSGDGRGIWNGCFRHNNQTWDISSCGTGATRLSPHYAQTGKPVRTGDPSVCYGSGWAEVDEGLSAAIMSEIFHSRGILTERTLVILQGPKGNAINVRAATNLLRPSHLFLPHKQNNQIKLRRALDCYIRRQIENNNWPTTAGNRYDFFLQTIAKKFALFAAKLEDEYIFHWLDWDGDNMLTEGGIIDYGSIRQFGLFHHHYRYDDVDRYSTNIKEQKYKAKALVQTFAQLIDFAQNGKKQELAHFSHSDATKLFEKEFTQEQYRLFLRRMGFSAHHTQQLLAQNRPMVLRLFRLYRYFVTKESTNSWQNVPDGINRPVAFDGKKLLRSLAKAYAQGRIERIPASDFVNLMATPYTPKKFRNPKGSLAARIEIFQSLYWKLIRTANSDERRQLTEMVMRSSTQAGSAAVTGDAIIFVVDALCKKAKKMQRTQFITLVEQFIRSYSTLKVSKKTSTSKKPAPLADKKLKKPVLKSLEDLRKLVENYSHTI